MANEDVLTVTVGAVFVSGLDVPAPLVHPAIDRLAVATRQNVAYVLAFDIVRSILHKAIQVKEDITPIVRLTIFFLHKILRRYRFCAARFSPGP